MTQLPVEKFVGLSLADYIEGSSLQNLDYLKNGLVAVASDYLFPLAELKSGMVMSSEQRLALRSLITGLTIYGYNWVMKTSESTSQIAKKALIAESAVYVYNRSGFKK